MEKKDRWTFTIILWGLETCHAGREMIGRGVNKGRVGSDNPGKGRMKSPTFQASWQGWRKIRAAELVLLPQDSADPKTPSALSFLGTLPLALHAEILKQLLKGS